jgi:hypothetical protein
MDDNTDMMSNIIENTRYLDLLYKVNHLRLDLMVTENLYIDHILLTRVKKL